MPKSFGEAKEEELKLSRTYAQFPLSLESIINIPENAEFLITKNYEGDPNKVREQYMLLT